MTHDGRKIYYPNPKNINKRNGTFPRAQRFTQYATDYNKTNELLGPGRYNEYIGAIKQYKQPCQVKYVKDY